jgi:hypothetical protein
MVEGGENHFCAIRCTFQFFRQAPRERRAGRVRILSRRLYMLALMGVWGTKIREFKGTGTDTWESLRPSAVGGNRPFGPDKRLSDTWYL